MPDVFDELVASPPVPAGGGPTVPDVYPRAIAVNPLDEILAQITRAQPVNAPITTNGNGDGTPSSREGGDIFDQLAAENVPTLAPQTVEVPADEQTAIRDAYGPGPFQQRAWSALKAGDPMLAQQIVGEAAQRGIEGAVPDLGEPLIQALKMDREDRSPAEVAKSIQANVDEPTRRAYKLATGQDMPPLNETHGALATAAYNTVADTANFFNSPEGAAITAATGGAAAIEPAIGKLITLGFSADAARSAIEAAIQGRTSDALESLGLAFGLGKAAHGEGAHVVGPEPGLVTPSEAKARGLEPIDLTQDMARGVVDQLTQPAPPVEAGVSPATPAPIAAPLPRLGVPETPAEPERGMNVLDEIRNAEARTTRAVQDLFPKAELTREQAAVFRRSAWGEEKAAPPPPQAPRDIFDELASEQAPPPSVLPEQAQSLASQFDELQGLGADIQSRIDALRAATPEEPAAPLAPEPTESKIPPDETAQAPATSPAALTARYQSDAGGFDAAATDLAARTSAQAPGISATGAPILEWAEANNRLIPAQEIERLPLASNSTSEHEVFVDEAADRAIKRTWPGVYGQVPELGDGRLERRNATPEEYLQRMALQNRVFGTDNRLEGVSVSDKPSMIIGQPAGQPSFVVSQSWLHSGEAPTGAEINSYLENEGFQHVPNSYFGWVRPSDGVAIIDAKPDNFVKTASGKVAPFDVQMRQFTPEQLREKGLTGEKAGAPPPVARKRTTVRERMNLQEEEKLRQQAADILVSQRNFHPEDAAAYAAKLGGKKELQGFIADNPNDPSNPFYAPAPPTPVEPPAPPVIAPAKNDIVTVSLGGREYPKTRITNVVETPEGTRYQVDVFGQKFVPAEQIKSIDQPAAAPAPIVEPAPDVQAKVDKVIRETKNRPDTAPAKMKVQKAYLLDALNTAHKAAPDEAPTSPEHDAELRALDAAQSPHNYIPGYYEMSQPDKETAVAAAKAQQQELFGKYGVESEGDKADSNLREAVTNARGRALPKITIEVPGDGTFEIINSKEAIAQFRDAARKRFPTTTLRPDVPTVGGRTTEAAIGAVSKKAPTREDLIKILGQAASTDETRAVLHNTVASTGNELVSTDGRRLIKVDYEGPKINVEGKGKKKGESKPAIFDIKTLKRDTAKEKDSIYPNWKKVVPDSSKLGTHGKYTTADTGSLMKLITQAEQVMGEKTKSVKLWMDDKGKLGITASSPDVGEFAGGDANPNTAKVLGAYDPQFLKDGLRMARQLGHEKVDLYLDKKSTDLSPLSIQAKGMEYVLMPMRISDSGSLAPIAERAAEHPMANAPAEPPPYSPTQPIEAARPEGGPAPAKASTSWRQDFADKVKDTTNFPRPWKLQAEQEGRKTTFYATDANGKFVSELPRRVGQSLEQLRAEAEALVAEANKPAPIAEPGTELGLGGTRKPRQTQPLTQTVAPNTTPQLAQTIATHTPGLGNTFAEIKNGLLQLVLPSARSPEHLRAANSLGSKLGPMHRRAEIANAALTPHERMFDRLGVDREGVAPADNVGTQFASAMSTGEPVPKGTSHAADMLKQQFDSRLEALRRAGAPLQSVRENYFPGMWTSESRLAFNAGLEEAMQAGVIPRDGFNVNDATPEQRAWVKARVDDHLAKGEGSEKDMLPYLSRNPLRGKETFRKPKVFDDIMDAQEFGLRPASNNPIRLGKVKLAEMDRSIMAHQYFSDLKNKGLLKITSPYEKAPEGWARINDPYGTIYGPPTVQLHEFVDQAVYQGLHDLAEKLGISHERGYGIGGTRLGYSVVGGDRIVTRYATETSVLAHELGHQLDERYGLWDRLEVPTKYGAGKTDVEKDLRAIADLTGRGKYARKKVEKMAQVIEAYVHAPEKMKEVAPTVFERFDNFVRSTPAIKELADIAPGIKLQKLTSEKYVGLPIMGYRVVPEAHGDILNNYLSSSLYNNKYFGPLYKAWMGGAGALNQAQLGVGSAFHVGFTSADVQVSAGAKMLKDIYGVLRGNRSIPDAISSAAKTATAIVHTPILGDKVLNEWRNPQAPLDSKIVAVTRAAELAGGGFHMERGLRTEQADKVRSDWYSGHKLRAALRSPVAATELMAKPIMEYLVPRQKAGVFAELASRIIEQNPGKSLEELTPQFRQAWNRVDARLGQVMYDRLFINNVAKNVMQGTLRAPGWTGGTIAELGGAFPDTYRFFKEWAATGRPPAELPDRVAYTASLLMGTMIANGALTYAFTGQQPHGMDYFAFRDGGKDDNGNQTRMVLPTYMKDILAYMRAPLHTLAAKTHPMINAIQELLNNKDYYGTEIRHPDDPLYKQGLQMGGYVAHQFVPFWLRGAQQQAQKSDIGFGRKYVAPYFGVMPAAKAITQSAAEGEAADISHAHSAVGGRTAEEAARSQARHQAIRDIAAHVTTATQERRAGHLLPGQEGEARHMARLTPLQRRIFGFGAEDSVRVWNKANETERGEIYRMVHQKIENSKILSRDRKRELLGMIGARPATVPVQ